MRYFLLSASFSAGAIQSPQDAWRLTHLKCIQSSLVVTQKTVQHPLHILDTQEVQLRQPNRLRGHLYTNWVPNFSWHDDSNDKLKPYGFCINVFWGFFLRIVMWGHTYTTNGDPRVIPGYFIWSSRQERPSHPNHHYEIFSHSYKMTSLWSHYYNNYEVLVANFCVALIVSLLYVCLMMFLASQTVSQTSSS